MGKLHEGRSACSGAKSGFDGSRAAPSGGRDGAGAPGVEPDGRGTAAIRVEYHLHTAASYDAQTSAAEVVDRALAARLDVLCVTDHDSIDGAVALAAMRSPGLRVVVGCEFTCDDGSHVIGLGLREMIAERRIPALLDAIHDQGAQVLLPHPFRRGSGIFRSERRRPEDFVRAVLSHTDAIECFNGRDTWENNRRSHRFAVERRLPAVAGSDAHGAAEIGTVWVEYDGPGFVHGVSPRRIYGPAQAPARENPLKRRVMELYHARERSLPPVVARAYRALRRGLHRDAPRTSHASPGILHDFPLPPEAPTSFAARAASDQARARSVARCDAAAPPLAGLPHSRDRGEDDFPG